MKPTQLANLLNISTATLRTWAGKEYTEFFSPSAQGVNGAKRAFSDTDARIVAWIALLKKQNTPTSEIRAILRKAQQDNWNDLPPLPGGIAGDEPVALVPREAVEERLRALQDRYETQLQAVVKERDSLQAQLIRFQQEAKSEREALQQRIVELTAKEAELRGMMQQYSFGGHRWNVATLMALALLLGVVLTLIIGLLITLHH